MPDESQYPDSIGKINPEENVNKRHFPPSKPARGVGDDYAWQRIGDVVGRMIGGAK